MNDRPELSAEQQQLIAGYVLYSLDPEEAAAVEQLLATSPAAVQELERLQQSLELAHADAEVAPPSRLRAALLGSDVSRADTVLELPPRPPIPWRWGLGAAAAVLIAGLGISNIVLLRSLARAQLDQATPELRTVALTPDDASSASVLVQIDTAALQATLGAENLPPLPPGQVYVLWTVLAPDAPFTTDDKNAILTQTFTVDDQGRASAQVALPPVYQDSRWVEAIAVTVETAEAPQRHEASPILIEPL